MNPKENPAIDGSGGDVGPSENPQMGSIEGLEGLEAAQALETVMDVDVVDQQMG